MGWRGAPTLYGLISRVRVALSPEAVSPPRPAEPTHVSAPRPRLADGASPFVQLARDVWAQWRPRVREAVQQALDELAAAEATHARPVCCGHTMRRHDCRPVRWRTWVGEVRARVTRFRCAECGAERRPLLETLDVEPG